MSETVETFVALNRLPVNAVVLDANEMALQRINATSWLGDGRAWDTEQIHLPAIVLWKPGDPVDPSDSLRARLTAFARDCTTHGDMTPAAERMLRRILEETK